MKVCSPRSSNTRSSDNVVLRLGVVALCFATFGPLVQCSSSDDGKGSPPAPEVTAVMGAITDTSGEPLEGVKLEGGGATATTDAKGQFELKASAAKAVVVRLTKDGYLPTQRVVDVQSGTATAMTASMMVEAKAEPLDADAGGTVTVARGAQLTASAGAFVDASGSTVAGMVDVHLTAFDPGNAGELAALPTLRAETGGGESELESFGVLDVTVRKDGEKLEVKSGEKLAIRIPVGSLGTAPETIPLWSYDEVKGLWIKEGEAKLNAAQKVYEAEIGHMSYWNCDKVMETTCVRGVVKVDTGEVLPGAYVSSRGVDYGGTSSATTNDEGVFCVAVRTSSKVAITAKHPLGGGQSREISSSATPASLPLDCASCADGGEWVVKKGTFSTGGEEVDCKTVGNPLSGTCADGLWSFGECFKTEGKCKMVFGGNITWDNGARLELQGTTSFKYYGPGDTLCGSGEVRGASADSAEVELTLPSGDKYIIRNNGTNDQTIVCPDGTEVTLSGADVEAMQACMGTNTNTEGCEIEGVPGQCTPGGDDCPAGQVCCSLQGISICMPNQETCDAAQQGS